MKWVNTPSDGAVESVIFVNGWISFQNMWSPEATAHSCYGKISQKFLGKHLAGVSFLIKLTPFLKERWKKAGVSLRVLRSFHEQFFPQHLRTTDFESPVNPWNPFWPRLLTKELHPSQHIYLLKVSNRNTRKRCKIFSKLTIKTPERCH